MKATTEPADYSDRAAGSITVHALKENKVPIGFAREWPKPKKTKAKAKK